MYIKNENVLRPQYSFDLTVISGTGVIVSISCVKQLTRTGLSMNALLSRSHLLLCKINNPTLPSPTTKETFQAKSIGSQRYSQYLCIFLVVCILSVAMFDHVYSPASDNLKPNPPRPSTSHRRSPPNIPPQATTTHECASYRNVCHQIREISTHRSCRPSFHDPNTDTVTRRSGSPSEPTRALNLGTCISIPPTTPNL